MRAAAAATRAASDATAAVQALQSAIAAGADRGGDVAAGMHAATVTMANRAAIAHARHASDVARCAAGGSAAAGGATTTAAAAAAAASDAKTPSAGSANDAWLKNAAGTAGRAAVTIVGAGAVAASEVARVAAPHIASAARTASAALGDLWHGTASSGANGGGVGLKHRAREAADKARGFVDGLSAGEGVSNAPGSGVDGGVAA